MALLSCCHACADVPSFDLARNLERATVGCLVCAGLPHIYHHAQGDGVEG